MHENTHYNNKKCIICIKTHIQKTSVSVSVNLTYEAATENQRVKLKLTPPFGCTRTSFPFPACNI